MLRTSALFLPAINREEKMSVIGEEKRGEKGKRKGAEGRKQERKGGWRKDERS
jgi:hypothetical protein